MPLQWNINSLATFVSLGGFFWGMDTDKSSTVAFLPLLIVSSLRLIGPVTVMPQFLKTFPEAKNMTIQGTLVATVSIFPPSTSTSTSSRRHTLTQPFLDSNGSGSLFFNIRLSLRPSFP